MSKEIQLKLAESIKPDLIPVPQLLNMGSKTQTSKGPVDARKRTLKVGLSGRYNARFKNSSHCDQSIGNELALRP
jgi:hypothetical protein